MDQQGETGGAGRIESVEAFAFAVPLERRFEGSIYAITHRTAIVARVRTADGLVGEGLNNIGEKELLPGIVRIIETEMAPAIAGLSVFAIERAWAAMAPLADRGGRDPRLALRALSAVDTALWDAFGKALGQPLHRLWGGHRDTIRTIAIAGYHREEDEPAAFGEEMRELQALGIGGCKFKVGGEPARDAARVHAAREAAGADFVLCADANRGWSRAQAIDFARRVDGLGLRWFEEPCRWRGGNDDMRVVRETGGIPVCAGQSLHSGLDCREMMQAGAVDVCNFDASWGGGPSEWRRVAGMAACFGVEVVQHGEPHLGCHLAGALANGTYMETHHPDRDPVFHKMVIDRGPFEDGMYRLPETPGWGVTLDWEALDRHRLNR